MNEPERRKHLSAKRLEPEVARHHLLADRPSAGFESLPPSHFLTTFCRDGSASHSAVMSSAQIVPTSWNARTGDLAYCDHRAVEVRVRSPRGDTRQVIAGPGRKRSARFSPDGKAIAYVNDETGDYQVYVAPQLISFAP